MKTEAGGQRSEVSRRTPAVAMAAVLVALWVPVAEAQNFSLNWWTVDGGGGTSSGGGFTVSGTVGQPDAGAMSGGNFVLEGGFWGVIAAIQTPGGPMLYVTNQSGVVKVYWLLPATDWVLERTNRLTGIAGPWPQVPFPYVTNATDISISVPSPTGQQFYRLRKN
jgi:hypothetical protein